MTNEFSDWDNSCNDYADTYYKIVGTWTDGVSLRFIVDDTNDRLIYNGDSGIIFLFSGASNVSTDKASTLTYGLYKNGTLVTGAESPVSFASPSKYATMAICSTITLNTNDYLEIWAKSDIANTTITASLLKIVFMWEI